MRFKKVKLYTHKLDSELEFYSGTLNFQITERNSHSFTVKVGWSELTFEKTDNEYVYHYCFLIPCNKLNQAFDWMEKRTTIIDIHKGRKTQHFESWNADSFYFYDAGGNIVELIARHELGNENTSDFDSSKVLGISEMGMPVTDIRKINTQLENELNTKFWKGDLNRFGTNGSLEGIFLLPNYKVKTKWFPTQIKINPEPFEAVIENEGKEYLIDYKNEILLTTEKDL